MNYTSAFAGISLCLLAAAPIASELTFGPKAGSTVTKVFETSLEIGLDDLIVNFNGQEMDPSMMGMDIDAANISIQATIEVEDEYGDTKGGRPMRLVRSFETIAAQLESGEGKNDSVNDADLEGATVTFTWNEESGSYDLASDDEELNLDEISHAGEDMDLRSLLPTGAVESGDHWELKGPGLWNVLWPGLDWVQAKRMATKKMGENQVPLDIDEIFGDLVQKSVLRCTYAGTRDVDGETLQVIELSSDIEHEMEIGDVLLELVRTNSDNAVDMDLEADLEIAAMLTGELLWDSTAGHFHQCDMEIELALLGSFDVEADVRGNPMAGTAEVEASGVLRRKAVAR